jgi:hypothetical protein
VTFVGDLDLKDDDAVYAYVRVHGAPDGAVLEAVDQDAPRVRQDDALEEEDLDDVVVVGRQQPVLTTTDDVLATTAVLADGVTQIRVPARELATTDGSVSALVVLADEPDVGRPGGPPKPVIRTSIPLWERQPDIYFRVTHEGRIVGDSRLPPTSQPVALNVTGGRIGRPEEPIDMTVELPPRRARRTFDDA